jgi:hypothetical protein
MAHSQSSPDRAPALGDSASLESPRHYLTGAELGTGELEGLLARAAERNAPPPATSLEPS